MSKSPCPLAAFSTVDPSFPALLERYAESIAALPKRESLLRTDPLVEEFLVCKSDGLEINYAPFDFVNAGAKVAIVGITPGWTQMEIAFRRASAVFANSSRRHQTCRFEMANPPRRLEAAY